MEIFKSKYIMISLSKLKYINYNIKQLETVLNEISLSIFLYSNIYFLLINYLM